MDKKDIEPSIYTMKERAAATATLDQEKAEAMDMLRASNNFSVTTLNEDNTLAGHVSFMMDEAEFVPFLLFVAIKAFNDLVVILDGDRGTARILMDQMSDKFS